MVLEDVPIDEHVLFDYVLRFQLASVQAEYRVHSALAAEYSVHGDGRLKEELAICKELNEKIKQLVLSAKKGAHTNGN